MKGNLIEMTPPDDEREEILVGGLPGVDFGFSHGAEELIELMRGVDKPVRVGEARD
jgi:hypothetical protein